jgi:bifunctional enzyme CysN/CysC
MDQKPLIPGRAYHLKIGTRTVSATVTTLKYRIDVSTREHISATTLNLNEIGLPRPDTTRCCSMATTSVTD